MEDTMIDTCPLRLLQFDNRIQDKAQKESKKKPKEKPIQYDHRDKILVRYYATGQET